MLKIRYSTIFAPRRWALLLMALPLMAAAALKGDTNGDGRYGWEDVWTIEDYVFHHWTQNFALYDANSDGRVSVSDVCQVLYKVLHPSGIDVGIGGWEEDDEDFGGVVSAPARPGAAPKVTFTIPDVTVRPGDEFGLEAVLTNSIPIYGMQFAVTLPQGLEYVPSNYPCRFDLLRDWGWDRTCDWGVSGRTMLWMHYSQHLYEYPGCEGPTMRMYLRVPDDTPEGEYRVHISAIDLVDSKFSGMAIDDFDVTVNVLRYITGDANDDGTVSVTDITTVVDHIMENDPSPFNFAAADVNVDGTVSVSDITDIVSIIMAN